MDTFKSSSRQPLPFNIGQSVLLSAIFVISGLAILAALIYFWVSPQTGEAAMTQPTAALTVTETVPRWRQWPAVIEATGSIEPWQEAVIGAQLSGMRLIEIKANVGDNVKRGELLARFDDEMLKADMAQLKANLAQAQAAATQAETNQQRVFKLKHTGSVSQQELLRYETEAKTSLAQNEAVKAQIAAKQLQLRYTKVVAPDDGVISARQATLGAVVAAGQELFRLIRQNRLEWRGELTSAQMAQSRPGQMIQLSLPDGSSAQAEVRQLAPSLDPRSRLGTVYADLKPGSQARAGMYAAGKLVLNESPALIIPATSVVIRDGRSYVLKLQRDGEIAPVSLQGVVTGRRQNTEVEIVEGISEADHVVVEGAGFLNDGDLVRIVQHTTNDNAS
ncbi:MAG: efflux RND transporter periplasmic adaptor subunit [Gammaproteobacteria bacterium]